MRVVTVYAATPLYSRLLIKSDVEPIFSQFKPEAGPVFKAMKIIPLEELLLKL